MTQRRGARYAYAGGTSFAAPEVAGVAALVWSVEAVADEHAGRVDPRADRDARPPGAAGRRPTAGACSMRRPRSRTSPGARASTRSSSRTCGSRGRGRRAAVSCATVERQLGATAARRRAGATASCRITVGGGDHASATLGRLGRCAFTLPARQRRRARPGHRHGRRRRGAPLRELPVRGLSSDESTRVADRDRPRAEDVGVEAAAMEQVSMIPGRVSDCRWRHGSQSSTPTHSTSPTRKRLPTRSFSRRRGRRPAGATRRR